MQLSPAEEGLPRRFDIELGLPDDLARDGRVFVEAYRTHPAARMRFDFGTVANVVSPPPEERRLTAFSEDVPPPLFRVKVTDVSSRKGRLLAEGRIRPVVPDALPDTRRGILHVHHKDLDGLVWELDLDNAGYEPTLWIDSVADSARDLAHDARFVALVYPEVLRRTLERVFIEQDDLSDDATGWGGPWVQFAKEVPGVPIEPPTIDADDDVKRSWIDEVVRAFARHKNFQGAFAQSEGSNG